MVATLIDLSSGEYFTDVSTFFDNVVHGAGYTMVGAPVSGAHTQSLRAASSSATWNGRNLPAGQTHILLGVRFNADTLAGNGRFNLFEVYSAAGLVFECGWSQSVAPVTLNMRVNGAPQGATASFSDLASWHYAWFEISIAVSGVANFWVDNTLIATYSGDTSALGPTFGNFGMGVMELAGGGGSVVCFTDYVCFSLAGGETLPLLERVVDGYLPNGGGTYSEFTPSGAAPNYQMVDEVPANDDTDYVAATVAGRRDTYAYPAAIVSDQLIDGVQTVHRFRDTAGTATLQPLYFLGGVEYPGAAETQGATYAYKYQLALVSPATAVAWTFTEVNAVELGQKLGASTSARVTQVALEVAHSGVPSHADVHGQGTLAAVPTNIVLAATLLRGRGTLLVGGGAEPSDVVPLWNDVDYTLNEKLISLSGGYIPDRHQRFETFYDYTVRPDVHDHDHEDKDVWTGAESTWTLARTPIERTILVFRGPPVYMWVHWTSDLTGLAGGYIRLAAIHDKTLPTLTLEWITAPIAIPAGYYIADMKGLNSQVLFLLCRNSANGHAVVLKYFRAANRFYTIYDEVASGTPWQLLVRNSRRLSILMADDTKIYSTADGGRTWQASADAAGGVWAMSRDGATFYVQHDKVIITPAGVGDVPPEVSASVSSGNPDTGFSLIPGTSAKFLEGGLGFVQVTPDYVGYGGAGFIFSRYGTTAPTLLTLPSFQDGVAQFCFFNEATMSFFAVGTDGAVVNGSGLITSLPSYLHVGLSNDHRFSVLGDAWNWAAFPSLVTSEFYITVDKAVTSWQTFTIDDPLGYVQNVAFVKGYN